MKNAAGQIGMDPRAIVVAVLGLLLAPALALLAISGYSLVVLPLVVVVVTYIIAVYHRLHWGAYIVVAGAMFGSEFNLWLGFAYMNPGDAAGAALVGVWVVRRVVTRTEVRLPPGAWLFLLFCLLTVLSTFSGLRPSVGYGLLARFLVNALGFIAVVDVLRKPAWLRGVLWTLVVCSVVQVVAGLVIGPTGGRFGGLADQPNIFGLRLALGAVACAALVANTKNGALRLFVAGGMTGNLLMVVLTVSRDCYLATVGALFWWGRQRRGALIVALLGGGSLLGTLSFIESSQLNFIERRVGAAVGARDASTRTRIRLNLNAVQAIAARPLLGVGYGQFEHLSEVTATGPARERPAHNFYLGMTASIGIPGMLCFFAFVGVNIRRVVRRRIGASRSSDPDEIQVAWLLRAAEAIAVCSALALVFRGGEPWILWTTLALLICAGTLPFPPAQADPKA